MYCWDLGLVVLSVERTNCAGVAGGVYKITVLAYLNVPNVTQTGSIISLLCLEEKEIKIAAFQVLFMIFFLLNAASFQVLSCKGGRKMQCSGSFMKLNWKMKSCLLSLLCASSVNKTVHNSQ